MEKDPLVKVRDAANLSRTTMGDTFGTVYKLLGLLKMEMELNKYGKYGRKTSISK